MRFVEVDITTHKVIGEYIGPGGGMRDPQAGAVWEKHLDARMGIHRLDITQDPPVMTLEPDPTPQKTFEKQFTDMLDDGFDPQDLSRIDARIDQIDTLPKMRAALKKIIRLIVYLNK